MIRLFKQYISIHKLIFIFGEGLLIFLAALLATYFFIGRGVGLVDTLAIIWPKLLLVTFITQLSLYFNDLYEFKSTDNLLDLASRLIQAIGITSIILAIVYFLWPELVIGQWVFFISLIFLLLFISSWRFLYSLVIRKRLFSEKAILLGAGELSHDLLGVLGARGDIWYNFILALYHKDNVYPLNFTIEQFSVRHHASFLIK